MGILGTSASEEAELRQAALGSGQSSHRPRQSVDASSGYTSSGYETADDYESEVDAEAGHNPENGYDAGNIKANQDPLNDDVDAIGTKKMSDTANNTSESSSIKDLPSNAVPQRNNEEYNEEELRRELSNRTYDEAVSEDILRTYSQHSKQANDGAVDIKDLDWDSPSDPDNPQNWPKWKKWFITMTVANVCLCVSLGSSLYVSGVPEIMQKFQKSQELCLSGLTFYLLGLGLGPVLMAPLSEIIGRQPVYMFSFPVSMLFTMGVGLAKNIRTILILRFFCGYIASPALSIAAGTISDLWGHSPQEMSIAVALFCVAPFLGPVIGPIVGGFAAQEKGWEWTMWVSLMFSGAVLPFLLLCPETLKHIILARRAKKRGIKLNHPQLDWNFFKSIITMTLLKPLKMLVVEPIVSLLSIYIAFIFAVLFGFFEALPIIFRGVHHFTLGNSGLPFIAVGLGLIAGVIFYIILDVTIAFPKNPDGTRGKRDADGNPVFDPPEKKLLVGKIGAFCLPISLFWLGWTGKFESVHWMAPTAAGFPFGFGLILVFFSVVLYFSMAFPPLSVASALAANNLLRYILASVFPLFTVQMYDRLNIGWASSVFAFISLAMVPLPFIFGKWGPGFRAKSQYGYAAYFKQLQASKKTESDNDTANESSSEPIERKV